MKVRQSLITAIALVVLAAITWLALTTAASWLRSLDASVAAALTTAILGLLGLWYAQWHSKSRDIAENHRESKIEVYTIFFDIVEKFQNGKIKDEELGEGELPDWLREDFRKLNRGLILWASPGVISAWLKFRAISDSGKGNILLAMDEMYKAIRKDLGNSNFGLRIGDLIRIGLKNPDDLKH